MFKHILVPTDGSKLAAKGIKVGVRLAKALGDGGGISGLLLGSVTSRVLAHAKIPVVVTR